MTTNNAVNVGLSGSTGTVNFVGSTSPTLVTPNIGVATSGGLTFSPTTAGIAGVTDASDAAAGNVGEYISSTVLVGSQVDLSNGAVVTVTSISLTAGDWDVEGTVIFNPAGSTVLTTASCFSTTTAPPSAPTSPNGGATAGWEGSTGAQVSLPTGKIRINISTTTTVYLSAFSNFSISTCGGFGFIGGRRIR